MNPQDLHENGFRPPLDAVTPQRGQNLQALRIGLAVTGRTNDGLALPFAMSHDFLSITTRGLLLSGCAELDQLDGTSRFWLDKIAVAIRFAVLCAHGAARLAGKAMDLFR